MASRTHRGIPLSALNPKFLHTNSTSHTWPFSAIAELLDNAYDPDVRAKKFWIDWTCIKGLDCLSFMDNGAGMTRGKMHKMLSFGFSDKKATKGHVPVGVYGNGFKSGSMRLGKDAMVFTKTKDSMTVGFLSQSYLEAIRAQQVLVPIITFMRDGQNFAEDAASLQAILKHSIFNTEIELFSELRAISVVGATGTRIIIWNLRNADRYDIRANHSDCSGESQSMTPESGYSLRAYCKILYLKPRMQIILRGQKVKTELISKSLAHIAIDNYRPTFLQSVDVAQANIQSKRVWITFGFNTKNKEHYGIMMYHKNRLIKAYERVGCQRKAEKKGVGVIGVIECNFLQPTHNKQDFDNTDKYRKTIHNLGVKLEEYWNEIRYKRKKEDPQCTMPIEDILKFPDQSWVQCDRCLKWRRLPDGIDCNILPEMWFCSMNPDPQFRSCHVEEEPEDQEEEQHSYPKTYKQERKSSKPNQECPPKAPAQKPLYQSLLLDSITWSPLASPVTRVTRSRAFSSTGFYPVTDVGTSSADFSALSSQQPRVKRKFSMAVEVPGPVPLDVLHPMTKERKVEKNARAMNEKEEEAVEDMVILDNAVQANQQDPDDWLCGMEEAESKWKASRSFWECGEQQQPLGNWGELEEERQQQQDELVHLMHTAAQERDACREELQWQQQEMQKLKQQSAALEAFREECNHLQTKLAGVEEERDGLSAQCKQLKEELKNMRQRENKRRSPYSALCAEEDRGTLWTLRHRIGRLLVSFVPALDLNQVDYNSSVIDEMLAQVLQELS
ncbi:MORC family CW-type zinc finger protein 3b isoform X2 [Denticeps clupeoides]|uniref:MORC family CW-type zinc finger protein 3b isoform X2 n=1 Tax=Denticeps clupeoides TaxID=299321 RepID=UPI0010A30DCF|nr:MORC family CW-type zinc finger protein 3-like isoform X2 [Denticeps clupeoides]